MVTFDLEGESLEAGVLGLIVFNGVILFGGKLGALFDNGEIILLI